MATNRSAAPLIAALILVLVLVPVLYVALYYCLVVPQGQTAIRTVRAGNQSMTETFITHYRSGSAWSPVLFWPMEQLDHQLRPGAWASYLYDKIDTDNIIWQIAPVMDDPNSP